jgi:hypothetical protein
VEYFVFNGGRVNGTGGQLDACDHRFAGNTDQVELLGLPMEMHGRNSAEW